jgi:hypothetical protein
MAVNEPDADMAALLQAQRAIHEDVHELINILAMLKGELDLAIDTARERLRKFYEVHPNL